MPESWEWSRFSSAFIINPRNNLPDDTEVSFVPMPLIQEAYANNHTYEERLWRSIKSGFTHFADNDIGVAKITPCFENKKSVVFKNLKNGYGAGTTELHIIRTISDYIYPEYVLWNLKTDSFITNGINAFSGAVGQKRIGRYFIENSLIPIPPTHEQKRIIDYISLAFIYIDKIDKSKESLKVDINVIKSKILDLAIRGKLVPQNPDDEPATVLLERIRAEKEELIKQGKIKRDKKESVIFKGEDNSYYEKIDENVIDISDEIPFDIPKNWVWCRLNTLCIKEIKRGKAPKYTDKSGTLVFAQKCNTKKGDIDISLAQYLDESILKKYSPEYFMQYNDIVINSTGTGTMGRVGIFEKQDDLYSLPIVADTHITTIRVTQLVIAKYVYSLLKSKQSYLETSGEGSTNQKELRPEVLSNILVPLPPALEQEQIINFINHINKTLNNIEQVLK